MEKSMNEGYGLGIEGDGIAIEADGYAVEGHGIAIDVERMKQAMSGEWFTLPQGLSPVEIVAHFRKCAHG